MNAESNLKSIDDLRAWLESMGVTTQGLLIVAAVAALLFVLSLREVLSWYLKVQHMRSEIRAMSAQVSEMQKSLEQMREMLMLQVTTPSNEDSIPEVVKFDAESAASGASEDKKSATEPGKRFSFDH